MAGIGAAIDVLRDRVLAVAGAIAKFFSGDFKGALEDGKNAVSGIGQEIANEFAAAAQATKTMQDLADSMREISVGRAKLNRDLAEAKEIMNNADASFAERRAALNKVRAAEAEQSKKELDAARAAYEERVKVNALSDSEDADLDKEAALQAKLYNLEESSANQLRALNRMDNTLRREEQAKVDAARKAREDNEKANWDNKLKDLKARADAEKIEIEQQNQAINDLANLDLENKKRIDAEKERLAQNELERASFAAQQREAEYKKEKAIDEQTIANKRSLYQSIIGFSSALAEVLGRSTVAGKAIAVAGAFIDTYAAVVATLKGAAKTPAGGIPGYAIAQAAAVGTVGLLNVKRIISVQVPGQGGIGSLSIPNLSAPLAPQQTSTSLDAGSIQGVGNAAAGGVNRSFVLDADIKSNSERQSRIARAARLG
jgi:hypothetical protein